MANLPGFTEWHRSKAAAVAAGGETRGEVAREKNNLNNFYKHCL